MSMQIQVPAERLSDPEPYEDCRKARRIILKSTMDKSLDITIHRVFNMRYRFMYIEFENIEKAR
eukprot:5344020-Karenia_brevis.AAC.1